jgi:primosomal protein N'
MRTCRAYGCEEEPTKPGHELCRRHWRAEQEGRLDRCERCGAEFEPRPSGCPRCEMLRQFGIGTE